MFKNLMKQEYFETLMVLKVSKEIHSNIKEGKYSLILHMLTCITLIYKSLKLGSHILKDQSHITTQALHWMKLSPFDQDTEIMTKTFSFIPLLLKYKVSCNDVLYIFN